MTGAEMDAPVLLEGKAEDHAARKDEGLVRIAPDEAGRREDGKLVYYFTIMLDEYPVFIRINVLESSY